MPSSSELDRRVQRVAEDRQSGASEILEEVIRILAEALSTGADVVPLARALSRGQPSMASVWNAAIAAVVDRRVPGRFQRFAHQVARAPRALARAGRDCLVPSPGAPLHLVTLSFSGTVASLIEALRAEAPVRVSCAEGRPALEGRRLAVRLASGGAPVVCCTDAALGTALDDADAVVVGADAVAPEWFVNKVGTGMLAALASRRGVPVYVIASRDKFVGREVARRLTMREGPPDEVWPAAPAGVVVRNLYFERIPLDLASQIVSDLGVLGIDMVPEVCEAAEDAAARFAIEQLA